MQMKNGLTQKKSNKNKTSTLKPIRYLFPNEIRKDHNFNFLKIGKAEFQWDAYTTITDIDGTKISFYICEYAYIFTRDSVFLVDPHTSNLVEVNPYKDLFNAYVSGYKEGLKYFSDYFCVSVETIYGPRSREYERDLHTHYYHTNFNNFGKGWGYYETHFSEWISIENLKRWGYYAGIISKVTELRKLYPAIFKNFDKCKLVDHKNPPPQLSQLRITILKEELVDKIYTEIKLFFPHGSDKLLSLLRGEEISEQLAFNGNQNRLVELFRRMHYNGVVAEKPALIKKWLMKNFVVLKQGKSEFEKLTESTVHTILHTGDGEARLTQRICKIPELPHVKPEKLKLYRKTK